MNFDKRPTSDRQYMEMIYSLVTELQGALMAQVRNINNTLAKVLLVMVDIQNGMSIINQGLKDNRDKRYEQEIDDFEMQIQGLRKQIEEKKIAKDDMKNTADIKKIASDTITQQREVEKKKYEINWSSVITTVVTAIVLAIVLYLLRNSFIK